MFRPSVSSRLFLLRRRSDLSFSYIAHSAVYKEQPQSKSQKDTHALFELYSIRHNNTVGGFHSIYSANFSRNCYLPFGFGSSVHRYSSSSTGGGSDKIEYTSDMADVLIEKTVDAAVTQASTASEVAVAAADSFFPVAALQYLIDGVHGFTGLNWWASIALTTILIRGITVPFLINQVKATSKLSLLRPEMEALRQKMQDSLDPTVVKQSQKEMKALFKKHDVTPFTPLRGILIQGPLFVSFYLAITNMVEKVPSFKEGGVYWFLDLTTADSLYIFPILTSLTFLTNVELNVQEGMEGNPAATTMKNFSRILAVLTVPFTMNFPKAIFCYWITSNLFSLGYGLVIKRPAVKKFLGLPEILPSPPSSQKSGFSLFGGFNPWKPAPRPPLLTEKPVLLTEKPLLKEKRIYSSSVTTQQIRNLEKAVKKKKKSKKR